MVLRDERSMINDSITKDRAATCMDANSGCMGDVGSCKTQKVAVVYS